MSIHQGSLAHCRPSYQRQNFHHQLSGDLRGKEGVKSLKITMLQLRGYKITHFKILYYMYM